MEFTDVRQRITSGYTATVDPSLSRADTRRLLAARFFAESDYWESVEEFLAQNPDAEMSHETRLGLGTYRQMKAEAEGLARQTVTPELAGSVNSEIGPGEDLRTVKHRIESRLIRDRLKALDGMRGIRVLTSAEWDESDELKARLAELEGLTATL